MCACVRACNRRRCKPTHSIARLNIRLTVSMKFVRTFPLSAKGCLCVFNMTIFFSGNPRVKVCIQYI